MKNTKNSLFLLLGIFVCCLFTQTTYAQEKVQPKKQVQQLKKGDKIRSSNGQRTVLDRKAKPAQRPAAQQNKPKSQARPVLGNKATVTKPAQAQSKQLRPVEKRPRPAAQNKTATQGKLRGIRQDNMARPRAMSTQNQQAMRSGHSKIKAMKGKLNAAKAKVAKEKAANPNSAEVRAKEARIQQAEAKIKAMEKEILNQRKAISNIAQ